MDIQDCVVNTMTVPAIADVTHAINDGALPIVFDPATWSDLLCLYVVSYSLSFDLNAAPIAQPSFIAFDQATRTITVDATLP